jgi:hypothetical protein
MWPALLLRQDFKPHLPLSRGSRVVPPRIIFPQYKIDSMGVPKTSET